MMIPEVTFYHNGASYAVIPASPEYARVWRLPEAEGGEVSVHGADGAAGAWILELRHQRDELADALEADESWYTAIRDCLAQLSHPGAQRLIDRLYDAAEARRAALRKAGRLP